MTRAVSDGPPSWSYTFGLGLGLNILVLLPTLSARCITEVHVAIEEFLFGYVGHIY